MNGSRANRWVPTRAGILNLWRYYDETFTFHNGRLLLRGPNGSGKSKALELLLPYLLDADIRASRLSTFGPGSNRSMHWNLMGEGATGTTRVGYLWLEFARGDTAETFTCGVRLRASKHNQDVAQDYFTTTARVGEEITFLNAARQPLDPRELTAALEGTGGVLKRAAYRERIRQTLYPGLSPQRYEALIRAMLQLRTPKLSELLDPKTLSDMLSQALPPMDETEMEGIADGFERLDRRRAGLDRLAAQRAAATEIDASQRRFARALLRTKANAATGAEAVRDRAGSQVAELQRGIEECAEATTQAEQRGVDAERGIRTAQSERDQLARNPLFDAGRQLKTERETLKRLEVALRAGIERATASLANAARLGGESDRAARTAQACAETAKHERGCAVAAAEAIGLHGAFAAAAAEPPGEESGPLKAAVRDQREALREVRDTAVAFTAAEKDRDGTERRREQLRNRHAEQEIEVGRARGLLAAAVEDWTSAVEEWFGAAAEFDIEETDRERIFDSGDDPVATAPILQRHYRVRADLLAAESARAAEALKRCETDLKDVADRLHELETARQVEPRPPATRSADRTGRPGGPLWRLIDFIGEPQAGLEAALEASGLLDAWVRPDGSIEHDAEDTFTGPSSTPAGTSLTTVLRPEPDGLVPQEVVARLLDGIGHAHTAAAADGPAAVGADGTWRLAGLAGRWSKPAAEFIGAVSRGRHRERLIVEAQDHVAECEHAVNEAKTRAAQIRTRLDRLRTELDAFPATASIHAAQRALASAEQRLGLIADQVADVEQELRLAEAAVRDAKLEVERLADWYRLPQRIDQLDRRASQLEEFDAVANRWARARLDHHRAEETAGDLARRAGEAREDAESLAEEQAEAESAVEEQRAAVEALDRTVGADLRELQEAVAACDQRLRDLAVQRRAAETELRDLAARNAAFHSDFQVAQQGLEAAAVARDRSFEQIRELLSGQVLSDARIDFQYESSVNVKATLEVARRLAAALEKTRSGEQAVASARNNLRDKYHQHRAGMADYAELVFEGEGETELLVAQVDGERIGPRVLADRLAFEHDRARGELTDDEQRLFNEILTGQIRASLAKRIREARQLVEGMNSRLERVETSSGMSVKLSWDIREGLDARAVAARELLLKPPEKLTDDKQGILRDFLAERVDALRESEDPRPWSAQLKDVFDYTAWHEFHLQFKKGEGWKRLTRRQHSNLSGGEKAVALHLPLFAALASHYETSPNSPRLLLLDEVLVGVDRVNRGQVFELVCSLDLDAVLTSEHEWGDYAELDGIAIHQVLAAAPGDDTVTTVRYVWDGTARFAEDVEEARL